MGDLAAATEATAALLSVLHAPQMHPRTLPPSPADCARLRQRTGAATVAVLCGAHGARGRGHFGDASAASEPVSVARTRQNRPSVTWGEGWDRVEAAVARGGRRSWRLRGTRRTRM